MINHSIKDSILFSLKKEDFGLPIQEIAKKIGASVQTTSKFCHILEAEKKVAIRKFGNMKLIKLK